MDRELMEVKRVLGALRGIDARINEMLARSPEGSTLLPWEAQPLREMTVQLKADIKAAAKRGKIDDSRDPQTAIESAYFDPALREASARFMLRTDTSPSTQKWRSGLNTVRGEITYYIWQLEREFPGI